LSLDGLRGVAALTVVLYHIALSDPTVGQRAFSVDQTSGISWFGYLMTFTPLHVLWAGSQAVLVFFVLSGLVLTLPYVTRSRTRQRGQWAVFYRSRAVRLYVPAIASLVLAWLTTLVVERSVMPDLPPWPNEHTGGVGPHYLLLGSSLMTGFGSLNGSLWSLRWEVFFSVLLPVFLIFAAWRIDLSRTKAALIFLVCAAWPIATGLLYLHATYILVFGLGVLMAFNLDRLGTFAKRIPTLGWVVLALLGCVLLTLQWIVMPAGIGPESLLSRMWMSYGSLGAVLLVFCAAFWPTAKRLLESRPLHALGVLSFSLYLVQEPVILNITLLTRSGLPLWLAIPVEVGAAILIAIAFYRLIEHPAHRLARALGRRKSVERQSPTVTGGFPPASIAPGPPFQVGVELLEVRRGDAGA
jgi:peptidoglycan/LPS O-acetylase OafA/YrhL